MVSVSYSVGTDNLYDWTMIWRWSNIKMWMHLDLYLGSMFLHRCKTINWRSYHFCGVVCGAQIGPKTGGGCRTVWGGCRIKKNTWNLEYLFPGLLFLHRCKAMHWWTHYFCIAVYGHRWAIEPDNGLGVILYKNHVEPWGSMLWICLLYTSPSPRD